MDILKEKTMAGNGLLHDLCTHMCLIRAHPCYYVGVDNAASADGVKKHQNPRKNQPGSSNGIDPQSWGQTKY